jgi:hypothetical protein
MADQRWWPGSAVTREGPTWQLEQMREQGMSGGEVTSVVINDTTAIA